MKSMLLGLLAETSIHPGSGRDGGFVDMPVAREAATDYPVVVGSSFKGALLDLARDRGVSEDERNLVFGVQDNAGQLLVSDLRLVALPVRSLVSHYKWVTCPHLLERLQRDLRRADSARTLVAVVDKGTYLGPNDGELFLEERQFSRCGDLPAALCQCLKALILHEATAQRLDRQLVVLHDDDFVWFARYGLSIQARNVLDVEKKTSKNLWYEETIPPDSLFYSLLAARSDEAINTVRSLFQNRPYLQVGGNASVGQGWFAVQEWKGDAQ